MIIHRSIFKELFINFLIVISLLSFVLFMEKFVRLTRLIMGKGVELIDIVKVFLFLQPSILLLAIPMAILIAVFLTYGRMTTDNEVIVLKGRLFLLKKCRQETGLREFLFIKRVIPKNP